MTLEPFQALISRALSDAGIPAMLTGSIAAAYRGVGRATMDVDFVIDPTAESLELFVDRIEALGMYVSRDAARDALEVRALLNVIDAESGWKADLIVRKARPFSQEEFERREPARSLGLREARWIAPTSRAGRLCSALRIPGGPSIGRSARSRIAGRQRLTVAAAR